MFDHVVTTNASVNCIFSDADGVVWLGTRSGLMRYMGSVAGVGERYYVGEPVDDIQQDADGVLWLNLHSRYEAYDPRLGKSVENRLSKELSVLKLAIDRSGAMWWIVEDELWFEMPTTRKHTLVADGVDTGNIYDLACDDRKLYILYRDGRLDRYEYDTAGRIVRLSSIAPPVGASDDTFRMMFIDSKHGVWLSQGYSGVWYMPDAQGLYTHFSAESTENRILPGPVYSIVEDGNGAIWIASDHGGISIYRPDEGLVYLSHDPMDNNTIVSDNVTSLSRDNDGNIWVGYNKRGASLWRAGRKAYSINHLKTLRERNIPDDINVTMETPDGTLWFGTDGNGLYSLNPETGEEHCFATHNSDISSDVITSMHYDSRGRMWVGTYYGGMTLYDGHSLRIFRHDDSNSRSLAHNDVWSIVEDERGRIWIGTLGGGVDLYDEATDSFIHYNSTTTLSNDYVLQLDIHDATLYVATAHGLTVYDISGDEAKLRDTLYFDGSLIGVTVDKFGLVWLNCMSSVVMYDPSTGERHLFDNFGEYEVLGLIEGKDGDVWCVTDVALHALRVDSRGADNRYTFHTDSYRFSEVGGLQFNERSMCRTLAGDLIIGSFDGYVRVASSFHAECDCFSARLCFTDLAINNQPIEVGERYDGHLILDRAMEYTSRLDLHYDENVITLNYACLDYSSSFGYELFYRVVGMSDKWLPLTDNSNSLTLYNLDPGKYRLELAMATGHGEQIESRCSLEIVVRPPWWLSKAAVVCYILFSILAVVVIVMIVRRTMRRRFEQRQKAIAEQHRSYVEQMKMQFFTNVSHDFRTPLTLIISPLEEMLRNNAARDDESINTIYRNARRLLTLVNQLLDLRKLDAYGMKLNLSHGDIANTVVDTTEAFRLLSKNSNVGLSVVGCSVPLPMDFDRDKVVKILTNLLSNAFKFTPEGGEIVVSVERSATNRVTIAVTDSGRGIADADKRRIFDRFYQSKSSAATSGTGIGLHIVREFVALHGGEVSVEDNKPSGSRFSFTLPIHQAQESVAEAVVEEDAAGEEFSGESAETQSERKTVLVVDDNDDFRKWLGDMLAADYNVIDAANGREALRAVARNDVDVVVCDVMMPVMDGMEFCRTMKSDINTSHIPIILLTARSMPDDEFSGLESGADDYVRKPFNMAILRLRIAKFLEWRRKTHAMFRTQLEVAPDEITTTTIDDKLIKQAIEVVNSNIDNADFSVADLSAALGMHRTHLYKKLSCITGKAPLEFIRSMRLKRAAQLLENDRVYVSEIAYMVGFNSPKLFARHFRDEFGMSPSEYRQNRKAQNSSN